MTQTARQYADDLFERDQQQATADSDQAVNQTTVYWTKRGPQASTELLNRIRLIWIEKARRILSARVESVLSAHKEYELPIHGADWAALEAVAVQHSKDLGHHLDTDTRECAHAIGDLNEKIIAAAIATNARDIGALRKKLLRDLRVRKDEHAKSVPGHDARAVTAPRPEQFAYDVAISFAGEDRQIAEDLRTGLDQRGITVFYDRDFQDRLWGSDLASLFHQVYSSGSRFAVLLISRHYARKAWPSHERAAAFERTLNDETRGTVLPIRIDGTEVLGIPSNIGYVNIGEGIEKICELIAKKIEQSRTQAAEKGDCPPRQTSHVSRNAAAESAGQETEDQRPREGDHSTDWKQRSLGANRAAWSPSRVARRLLSLPRRWKLALMAGILIATALTVALRYLPNKGESSLIGTATSEMSRVFEIRTRHCELNHPGTGALFAPIDDWTVSDTDFDGTVDTNKGNKADQLHARSVTTNQGGLGRGQFYAMIEFDSSQIKTVGEISHAVLSLDVSDHSGDAEIQISTVGAGILRLNDTFPILDAATPAGDLVTLDGEGDDVRDGLRCVDVTNMVSAVSDSVDSRLVFALRHVGRIEESNLGSGVGIRSLESRAGWPLLMVWQE